MYTKIHQKCPREFTRRKCPLKPILKKVFTRIHCPREVSQFPFPLFIYFSHYFPVCNSGGSAAAGSVSSEVTLKFPLFSPLCLALLWLCLGSSVHQKVVFEELCGSEARLRALLSVRAKRKWVAIEEMSRKSILHDIQIWLYTIKRASVDHVFKSSSSLSCELSQAMDIFIPGLSPKHIYGNGVFGNVYLLALDSTKLVPDIPKRGM